MERRQVPDLEPGTWTLYFEAVTVYIFVCIDLFNGSYLEEGRVNGILSVQLFIEPAILVSLFSVSPLATDSNLSFLWYIDPPNSCSQVDYLSEDHKHWSPTGIYNIRYTPPFEFRHLPLFEVLSIVEFQNLSNSSHIGNWCYRSRHTNLFIHKLFQARCTYMACPWRRTKSAAVGFFLFCLLGDLGYLLFKWVDKGLPFCQVVSLSPYRARTGFVICASLLRVSFPSKYFVLCSSSWLNASRFWFWLDDIERII